jgi:hypothetical protein
MAWPRFPDRRESLRLRSFVFALSVPVLLLWAGTLGYMAIEGWTAFDALYMTVTTITAVGFMELHPLSRAGRVFTMSVALVGVFSLFYAASAVIRGIVSGLSLRDRRPAHGPGRPAPVGGGLHRAGHAPGLLRAADRGDGDPGGKRPGRSQVTDQRVRAELGIIIVAIKRADGQMTFNPAPDVTMQGGDTLIALGHRQQLERLETLARGEG